MQNKTHNTEMTTLKGNLSKKLKIIKPKLTHNTPEKSDIARMFEKMKQKKDKILPPELTDIRNKDWYQKSVIGPPKVLNIKCYSFILLIYVLGDNIDYRGRPTYAGRPKISIK